MMLKTILSSLPQTVNMLAQCRYTMQQFINYSPHLLSLDWLSVMYPLSLAYTGL